MTSKRFETALADLEECSADLEESKGKTARQMLAEIKGKYAELLAIANDAAVVSVEMRHRAGRLYSELHGMTEGLVVMDAVSYFDYIQIMADLGAILAAVM